MQRLSVFLFTSILGKKIYDEFDDVLGELKDIYVTTEQGYPRVIGYKVKRDGVTFHYEFRSIGFYSDDNKVKIMTRGSKEILRLHHHRVYSAAAHEPSRVSAGIHRADSRTSCPNSGVFHFKPICRIVPQKHWIVAIRV